MGYEEESGCGGKVIGLGKMKMEKIGKVCYAIEK